MRVMVLEEEGDRRAELAQRLAQQGHEVRSHADLFAAMADARATILDLLVLNEHVGGQLSHPLALLAEWRNPGLSAVMLTDREGEAREELAELLPMVRRVLPRRAPVAQVAGAAASLAAEMAVADAKATAPTAPETAAPTSAEKAPRPEERTPPAAEEAADAFVFRHREEPDHRPPLNLPPAATFLRSYRSGAELRRAIG